MLDIKKILSEPEFFKSQLSKRGKGYSELIDKVTSLYNKKRAYQKEHDEKKFKQKELSKVMSKSDDKESLRKKLKEMSLNIKGIVEKMREIDEEIRKILLVIPNIPQQIVPVGEDENSNTVVREWGDKPNFDFTPLEHYEIGERLKIFDFKRASKISGSRFVVYKGDGAKLERALASFMLDVHTQKHGYKEILPPYLVNEDSMIGTGQLPKFYDEAFSTNENLFLIPTAEVPVTNLHRNEILDADMLPIKYVAYSACFRREAGSYGKDVKGIIRQHQFQKVELVKFTKPEDSYSEHESLVKDAEKILQLLGLHYRVVELCTGDLGFSASRCFDLEVWLPGQNRYREISSCSNFEDYQARRANIRFRRDKKSKPEFVHTLNGSGLAIGRTLVAILENYQQKDGTVKVPEVLIPYMGKDTIKLY